MKKYFLLLALPLFFACTLPDDNSDDSLSGGETMSIHVPRAVDMGLSVKWADSNLGAASEECLGGYYAWGETETKKDYSWATYKWANGAPDKLTKYNSDPMKGIVDNKTVLDRDDDVAAVRYGGKWRIPTNAEWDELFNECNVSVVETAGVAGLQLVSRTTGNSIFLPAVGGYMEGENLKSAGSNTNNWSSNLDEEQPENARNIVYVTTSHIKYQYLGSVGRHFGFQIRAVTD